MGLKQEWEKTELYQALESFIQELGVCVLFWKEMRSRRGLKIELTLFSKQGVGIQTIDNVYSLLVPRLQALTGTRDVFLDISSPGVERILKTLYELPFFIGYAMAFSLEDRASIEGVLTREEGGFVFLQVQGVEVCVEKMAITRAKLIRVKES